MQIIKLKMKNGELTSLESSSDFEIVVYDYDLNEYENIDPELIQTDENLEQYIELVI